MASTARPNRRLRLAVAGAAVVTVLTTATAAASPPTPMGDAAPMGVQAPGMARSGARPNVPSGPRSRLPVFVLDKGRFTAFDAPGQEAAEFQRINNRGEIVGSYSTARDAPLAGYLRDKRGRFTEIAVPGAVATAPLDNNDRGELVGNYQVEVGGALRGFLRDRRGRYTTIQVPGSLQTQAAGINNRGQVVGDYQDAAGRFHGYLWTRGRFTTIDGPAGTGASLTNLNDRGQIIGLYAPPGPDTPGRLRAEQRPLHHLRPRRQRLDPPAWHQRPRPGRRRLHQPRRRADPATHQNAAEGPQVRTIRNKKSTMTSQSITVLTVCRVAAVPPSGARPAAGSHPGRAAWPAARTAPPGRPAGRPARSCRQRPG
jgi:probable HAF family extracellular repeat protein